jgi:hypothetical protein
MARIDQLLASYRRHVSLTPRGNLPLSQRVWFVVYPPEDERRLVNRIPEFEIATRDEGLDWRRIDLGGAFADWMDTFDPDERRTASRPPTSSRPMPTPVSSTTSSSGSGASLWQGCRPRTRSIPSSPSPG